MADGTHIAIEDIDAGDQVVAFDTETSTWTTRTVTDQWGHLDEGTLTAVTLADGSSVTSTAEHLYWSVDAADDQWHWVEAQYLDDGDYLATRDGNVEVANTVTTVGSPEWVWELSVETDHNFTVHTGTVDVVLHNADGNACNLNLNGTHGTVVRNAHRAGEPGFEALDTPNTARLLEVRTDLDDNIARAKQAIEADPGLSAAQKAAAIAEVEDIQVHHIIPRQLIGSGFIPGNTTQEARAILEDVRARIRELGVEAELEDRFGSGSVSMNQLADDPANLIPMPTTDAQIELLRSNGSDWPLGQVHNGSHGGAYHDDLVGILMDNLLDTRNFSSEELRVALQAAFEEVVSGTLRPRIPTA